MHMRSFCISGVRAYCVGLSTTTIGGAGQGVVGEYFLWVRGALSACPLTSLGLAEDNIPFHGRLYGCLLAGSRVGIGSWGLREFAWDVLLLSVASFSDLVKSICINERQAWYCAASMILGCYEGWYI